MNAETMRAKSHKIMRQIYSGHQVCSSWLASLMLDTIHPPTSNEPTPFDPDYLVKKEEVSPEQFISMMNNSTRDNIISARILPPKLGVDNDFGSIEVEYRFSKLPNQQDRHVA